MNKILYLISFIVSLLASLICLFIKWQISTGIILGTVFSLIYFFLLNKSYSIDENGNLNKGNPLGFFLRIIIIALPLLISCLLPNYFNIFGAFGGVMLFRIVMMITFFKKRGEI